MGKGGGGHGGLNILPQKSWNVYNFDNRLIVEQDEVGRHPSPHTHALTHADSMANSKGPPPLHTRQ